MTENKVSIESATKEVEGWLDHKKISKSKRELQKDAINTLIEGVCEGTIRVESDFRIIQTLKFPIESELTTKEFEFKPRLAVNQVHTILQSVKATDADGRILAYIAALTSKPKGLIQKMDTEDYSFAQSIAIFFL